MLYACNKGREDPTLTNIILFLIGINYSVGGQCPAYKVINDVDESSKPYCKFVGTS
jgi:hypothetical protein